MDALYNTLIDKAINCLRSKIDQKKEPICTIQDIMAMMHTEDQRAYKVFTDQAFLNKFYEAKKVHSKGTKESAL